MSAANAQRFEQRRGAVRSCIAVIVPPSTPLFPRMPPIFSSPMLPRVGFHYRGKDVPSVSVGAEDLIEILLAQQRDSGGHFPSSRIRSLSSNVYVVDHHRQHRSIK